MNLMTNILSSVSSTRQRNTKFESRNPFAWPFAST